MLLPEPKGHVFRRRKLCFVERVCLDALFLTGSMYKINPFCKESFHA